MAKFRRMLQSMDLRKCHRGCNFLESDYPRPCHWQWLSLNEATDCTANIQNLWHGKLALPRQKQRSAFGKISSGLFLWLFLAKGKLHWFHKILMGTCPQ